MNGGPLVPAAFVDPPECACGGGEEGCSSCVDADLREIARLASEGYVLKGAEIIKLGNEYLHAREEIVQWRDRYAVEMKRAERGERLWTQADKDAHLDVLLLSAEAVLAFHAPAWRPDDDLNRPMLTLRRAVTMIRASSCPA